MFRSAAALLCGVLAAGCGPPSAIEIAPGAAPRLAAVESVFLDAATARTGDTGQVRDLRPDVEALMSRRTPPIAGLRDAADAILVFELSDRLECVACTQSEDQWQWWGFVFDLEGRELASLHGELPRDHPSPSRPFVKAVARLLSP